MKILKHERPKPKWVVAPPSLELWRDKLGCKERHRKIGQLPRGVREELNSCLQRQEPDTLLASWLNGLPETHSASPENSRYTKITVEDLADWKKGGFRDWQIKQERRRSFARHCLNWARRPEMQDKLFGRRESWLEIHNEIRRIFGREPLARENLPDDQDWDAIPTPKQRRIAAFGVFGLTPEGKDMDKGSYNLGYFGPPRAGSASKKTINPKQK